MSITIKQPKTEKKFEDYYELRWRVLRQPWQQPKGSEKDELENESFHIMAWNENNNVIGVGRLHFNTESEAQIRYMAVDSPNITRGTGTLILEALEEQARLQKCISIILEARESTLNFYEKREFIVSRKSHILYASIQHYRMAKCL